jgi:hypothetical protein
MRVSSEDQVRHALGCARGERHRHIAAHREPRDSRAFEVEVIHQLEDVARVVVNARVRELRIFVGQAHATKSAKIGRDEPPSERHARQLRQPHVGAHGKRVNQHQRANAFEQLLAGETWRFEVARRARQKVGVGSHHARIVVPV